MKTTKKQLFTKALLFLGVVMFALVSCKKDDPAAPDPIASFQYEISATNYLMVTFTNFSQNAATYSWNFGDGNTSTEASPVHTYTGEDDYTVVLTATNKDGVDHQFQAVITITDPDKALKRLTGEVSKTWKLYRVESSMGVGPSEADPRLWWALYNDGSRPCVYNHEFTFTLAGAYIFDDNGFFWSEGLTDPPVCIEAIPANMVNLAGTDVSAWLSGTHSFEYTPSTGMVTLSGLGAWIGLPKTGTTGEVTVPQTSVTFKVVSIEEFDGYDLMNVRFIYDGVVWDFTYAHYSNPALEPAVVSFMADFSFTIDDFVVTFENLSKDAVSYSWDFGDGNTSTDVNPVHTYAAEGSYTVVLTATSGSGETKTATKTVSISLNPTVLAPNPTEPAANVISIYSDAYTAISGVNLNPSWGQATATSEIEISSEKVLKMAGLNYQGIDFAGNAQNVSGKTKLHVDIYCSVATTINLSVIGAGENPVTLTTEAGVWKSFDILLSEYTVPDLTAVIQLKFDDAGTGTAPTIFVDNIYFY